MGGGSGVAGDDDHGDSHGGVAGSRAGSLKGTDMSTLDALLHDDDDLEPVTRSAPATAPAAGVASAEAAVSTSASEPGPVPVSAEWGEVIKQYIKEPSTPLEKERQELLASLEYHSPETLSTEHELSAFKRNRTETELLARARLAVMYERKEAARRRREGSAEAWPESLPAPALELDDEVG